MTVAIVDDEQHCTDRLLGLLKPYGHKVTTVCFDKADEAVKGIETCKPDIVFLDVQLNGKTGFDVLSAVSYRNFCLVFTTAYEQYAIEAFKVSAIDYLLKPVAADDFQQAMHKSFERLEQGQLNERIAVMFSQLSKENSAQRITIPFKDGYSFLKIRDIVRCEAEVNYTHIFTSDGKKHTVSKSLKHFEELLSRRGFFRIHNAHLINLDCVKSYAKSGYVTLLDNTKLQISVRRKEAFMKICSGTS